MPQLFTLAGTDLPLNDVLAFRGREGVSQLYQYDVLFSAQNLIEIDPEKALATRAALTLHLDGAHVIHGTIAALEVVNADSQKTTWLATIVPSLWHLTHSIHSRIFTDNTIPEIIEAILLDSGMSADAFRLQLVGAYQQLEHVCQYRETSFDFISRLMEREGMYYFFEHGDSHETLVITDDMSTHQPAVQKPVRYDPWNQSGFDALAVLRGRFAALPRKIKLTDYDYEKPELDVSGSATITPNGYGDIVLYGENFKTPTEGNRYAKLRAEEYLARRSVFTGGGMAQSLRSGYTFTLEEHPRASFNQTYLVTTMDHQGHLQSVAEELLHMLEISSKEIYSVELGAIPSKVQYRAPRDTRWPRIDGVVDGVVDGAAGGPYAEVDDQGRYKVRIFFDESDLVDGSASTWVRMLQPHGGGTEGFHFPLRKGTEIHFVFLGGDPDRPTIVGVAPNAQKPSPVAAGNFTQNIIVTGASNMLEMGDTAGAEHATLSTPMCSSFLHLGRGAFAVHLSTACNSKFYTGGNHETQIDGTLDEEVMCAVTEKYLATRTTNVVGALTQAFENTWDLTVDGAVTQDLRSTLTDTVNGAVKREYKATYDHTVTGAVTETFDAAHDWTVASAVTHTFNTSLDLTVNGPTNETLNGNVVTGITGTWNATISSTQGMRANGDQTISAPNQNLSADATQALTSTDHTNIASASISMEAPSASLNGTGSADVRGGTLALTSDSGVLTVASAAAMGVSAAGAIDVSGGGTITVTAPLIKLN